MSAVGTRLLTLSVEGSSYTDQAAVAKITSGAADTDFLTFADAAAGGARQYNLEINLVQDLVAGTLWRLIWDSPGSEVDFIIAPYGNAVPSPTQPHVAGTAVVAEPDGDLIGGQANVSTTAKMAATAVWKCTAKPVLVTA